MSLSKLVKRISNRFENWIIFYILIIAISGLTSFVVQMLSTGLPLYCIDIGKTTAQSGIFAGFYSAAVILSRPFVGKWTDEKGKWNVAFVGIALLVLSVAGMTFLAKLSLFSLYHVLEGLAFSGLSTALAALMVDILPPATIIKGIALFTVIKSFSISLGASYAVSFVEKHGSKNIFLCTFIILVVAFFLTIILKRNPNNDIKNKGVKTIKQDEQLKGIDKFVYKKALPICLVQFTFTFCLTLATCYLPSYAQSIGLAGVGIYYTVSAVTMLLTRTVLSKLIDKLNPKIAYIVGMFLASITTIGVLFSDKLIYFVFLSIPNAIGISLINPLLNVKATGNVEANRRGVASSTYYASLDLGSGAGSMVWGLLVPQIGYNASFISSTILLVLIFIYGLRIVKE